MRLARVQHRHAWRERLVLWLLGRFTGKPPADVLRALLYRPAFFGARLSALIHEVMRGESTWTVGERELFAAFVSSQARCPF